MIGQKEARESKAFLILWMGIIEDVFQMEGNECKNQERSMPERGRCFSMGLATLSGPVAVNKKRFVSAARNFSEGEGEAKREMHLFTARGSAELEKVASGSATQSFWLENRKVGSQVIGEDRSRLLGRRTVGNFWRGRRASDRTKDRVHRFRWERRASFMACLSLCFGLHHFSWAWPATCSSLSPKANPKSVYSRLRS